MSRPRLTASQKVTLDRVVRLANRLGGMVAADYIGSRATCKYLIEKGYIEVARTAYEPHGREIVYYRPIAEG
jgi:hypothetical protein